MACITLALNETQVKTITNSSKVKELQRTCAVEFTDTLDSRLKQNAPLGQ